MEKATPWDTDRWRCHDLAHLYCCRIDPVENYRLGFRCMVHYRSNQALERANHQPGACICFYMIKTVSVAVTLASRGGR